MDEIDELKKKVADLETEKAQLNKDKSDLEETNKTLNIDLADTKKRVIEKTDQFVKLRDMTKEQRDKLTEKEVEVLQRQEQLEEKQKAFEETQKADAKKRFDESLDKYVGEKSKGNKELADKIKFHFNRFKDEVSTDTEIAKRVEESLNLVKVESPDLVSGAVGADGHAEDGESKSGFDQTAEGQELAKAMGLGFANKKEEAK